jgi:uncharacterized protein (TIGR03437 family)
MRHIECYLILATLLGAAILGAQPSVVTYHNDNARTGQYLNEVLLSPHSVGSGLFGKREFLAVDGAVFAQPLYLSRVKIAGKGFHNVLFVATSHDSLYAFDADADAASPPLWQASFLDTGAGVSTVSGADVGCDLLAELGITGTPVIDAASGTIYLIAFTKEPQNQYVYRLHALDVTSGAERPGSPVEIQPTGFVALAHKQRTALLLLNGVVYSSWSGHCDNGTYHGWLMAHDAANLSLISFFNASPGDSGSSFWNGGAGPAADEQGNIYVVSANGDFDGDVDAARYDESVLRFTSEPGLLPADQFTPFNKFMLDTDDLDLGSSGAIVLPDEAGNAAHPHLLFTAGKEGRMYLLDREALGGAQTGSDPGALASLPVLGSETFGSAAYFNGSVYLAPTNSPLLEFSLVDAQVASAPLASSSSQEGIHGAIPSISANGSQDGIAWLITEENGGGLLAFDAGNLKQLYDSSTRQADQLLSYAEFAVPTIADGKVFAGTYDGVAVFGEGTSSAPAIAAVTNAASYATDAISPGSLISIFGSHLAALTVGASAIPLPMSIADTSVIIGGVPAPVLFESPGQINAQVPWEVAAGTVSVVVRSRGSSSAPANITVEQAGPGIFTEARGAAAVSGPLAAGSVISVFFTGQGPVAAAVDDGAAPAAGKTVPATLAASATIGGTSANIEFVGLSPQFPGVAQINLRIPALSAGVYSLVVTIGGKASNVATIAVQ